MPQQVGSNRAPKVGVLVSLEMVLGCLPRNPSISSAPASSPGETFKSAAGSNSTFCHVAHSSPSWSTAILFLQSRRFFSVTSVRRNNQLSICHRWSVPPFVGSRSGRKERRKAIFCVCGAGFRPGRGAVGARRDGGRLQARHLLLLSVSLSFSHPHPSVNQSVFQGPPEKGLRVLPQGRPAPGVPRWQPWLPNGRLGVPRWWPFLTSHPKVGQSVGVSPQRRKGGEGGIASPVSHSRAPFAPFVTGEDHRQKFGLLGKRVFFVCFLFVLVFGHTWGLFIES